MIGLKDSARELEIRSNPLACSLSRTKRGGDEKLDDEI
jgi:hypothetical protein